MPLYFFHTSLLLRCTPITTCYPLGYFLSPKYYYKWVILLFHIYFWCLLYKVFPQLFCTMLVLGIPITTVICRGILIILVSSWVDQNFILQLNYTCILVKKNIFLPLENSMFQIIITRWIFLQHQLPDSTLLFPSPTWEHDTCQLASKMTTCRTKSQTAKA